MRKQSTRDIGNKLEKLTVSYLEDIDSKTKQSNNSGAVSNNSDILNKYFFTECKQRNVKNITVSQKIWRKLNNQIPVGSLKIPLLVLGNIDNEVFAVLNMKDFHRLIKELYLTKEKG